LLPFVCLWPLSLSFQARVQLLGLDWKFKHKVPAQHNTSVTLLCATRVLVNMKFFAVVHTP